MDARQAQIGVLGDHAHVEGGIHLHRHEAPTVSPTGIPLQRPPRAEHFTDREKELRRLLADLRPGRVVTLCGPGGIGKTALAAEAVWTLAPGDEPPERFPHGIILHSFYNQPQAALAFEAIARAYGEEPRPTSRDAAQRALAGKRALLILDGTEQADDLRDFASFLGIETPDDGAHPLAAVPDERWRDLDTAHVAAYLEHLKQATSEKTGRPYSTATVARRMTAVRELLTEAAYHGLFPRQRLEYLKERLTTPQVTHEHHGGITPDEQARLLERADAQPGLKGQRDYALFRLWLDTGLRREEMAALKVRDLTVKDGTPTLVVRHGKGDKTREVGLEGYTAHVVQDWLKASGQEADPDRPVFCQVRKSGRGGEAMYRVVDPEKPLSGVALWKLVLWYCEKAGIESKVTPHSFRVAMVTDSLDGGAPLQHVQAAGGWSSTRMITQVYDRNKYADPVARYRKTPLPRRAGDGNRDGKA